MEEGLRRGTGTESPEQASTAACFRSVAKEMKYTLEIVLVLFFGNGVCFEMDKITLKFQFFPAYRPNRGNKISKQGKIDITDNGKREVNERRSQF